MVARKKQMTGKHYGWWRFASAPRILKEGLVELAQVGGKFGGIKTRQRLNQLEECIQFFPGCRRQGIRRQRERQTIEGQNEPFSPTCQSALSEGGIRKLIFSARQLYQQLANEIL